VATLWSPEAEKQLEESSTWWAENRPSAPDLFDEELARALEQLRVAPLSGTPYRQGTRRVLLERTRYALVYRAHEAHVEIVSLWSMLRGKPPRLGGER
jgi:plasmid stabilization system protein ParE